MRLSTQDHKEFLKAAIKTTDKGISDWLVGIVDALDALPEGKNDLPCPAYLPRPVAPVQPNGQPQLAGPW